MLNISINGACISLNKQLKIGEEYTLNIESNGNTIPISGFVVWERLVKLQRNEQMGDGSPVYEVGIKFKDVLTDKGINLLSFIDKNIFLKQSMVRLRDLRVKITGPKAGTLLANHRSSSVIKLSLGGMLIETDKRIRLESKHNMEISIPKLKQPVKFLGRVASHVEIDNFVPRRYGLGIEFLKMSQLDKLRLGKFLKSIQNI